MLLDTGATSSAISENKAKELKLKIFPTKHKLVQIDESYLSVCGEILTLYYRDNLEFKCSALVVKKMGFDIIGGTNFHKENDIYCPLSSNKIVVKGIHSFNSTPYVATLNKIKAVCMSSLCTNGVPVAMSTGEKRDESLKILMKCNKSETILPGESQFITVNGEVFEDDTLVEIEPRNEGPNEFPKNQLQRIKNNTIKITNDSKESIKVKKQTPLCQIRATVAVEDPIKEDEGSEPSKYKPGPPDLS